MVSRFTVISGCLGFTVFGSGCVLPTVVDEVAIGTTGDVEQAEQGGPALPALPSGEQLARSTKIDILLVIDNSGSMGEEQGLLAQATEQMLAQLEQVQGVSYRIGVTTTDNGSAACSGTGPEGGKLQLSSCRGRPQEFRFMGAPGSIDAFEDACLSRCEINEIDIAPTYYEPGDNAIRRSWIEVTDGQSNVIGAPVEDALRCAIPQGIAGCGFESPLEAARLAILRSKEPGEPNHGFMRPDAHLAIVIVSDEVDCSIAPGMREAAIFEPDPDNDISPFPTSAVCWQAGVQCTGGPGTYDQCSSANIDENGVPTAVPALAVLEPVDTYTNFFAEIAAEKRLTTNASVMLFGVMGVPVGYPATPITYADATDPAFQTEFGIEPGCTHESGTAIPPVRVRDLMASLSDDGMSTGLRSICDPQLQDVFVSIFGDMAARMIQ